MDIWRCERKKEWSNAEIAKKVGKNDVYVGNCIFAASLPEKTRDLINKGQLFVSNQFISRHARNCGDQP